MGIYKDKASGNYGIRIEYNGRDHKKIIGKDKRTAQIALNEIKNEIRIAKLAGQKWDGFEKLAKAKRLKTFSEAAKDYMDERANFKRSTIESYQSILNTYLVPEFGNYVLKEISESLIRKFLAQLAGKVSASRANTVTQLFRSILGQAYRSGEIEKDPSLAVKRLQEPKVKIDPLSEDELEKAIRAVDPYYQPFFKAQAFTGARPNELQALRWSDVDLKNEVIHIRRGRVRGHEGLPKTASGERSIPITPLVREALEQQRSKRICSLDEYVFTKPDGLPIDKHMDRIWSAALKRCGVRHRPSYQLRHTFITHCIVKGFPIPYIAKLVGHSTIDTLIRHYAAWIDNASAEQEKKLKEAFSLPEKKPEGKPEGPQIEAVSILKNSMPRKVVGVEF